MVQVETHGLHGRLAQAAEVVKLWQRIVGGGGRLRSWFLDMVRSHWKRRLSKYKNSTDTESNQVPLELVTITWQCAEGNSGYKCRC